MNIIHIKTESDSKIYSIPAEISFDIYGNLYLSFSKIMDDVNYNIFFDNNYEYLEYQINVDKYNKLTFEYGDYKIIDYDHKIKVKKIISEKLSELIEDTLDIKINDSDDDSDVSIDDDIVQKYGQSNVKFIFSDDKLFSINNRYNGDIMALYDTYCYEKNNLKFYSKNPLEESFYNINLKNDKLYFEIIGEKKILYDLYVNKNGEIIYK